MKQFLKYLVLASIPLTSIAVPVAPSNAQKSGAENSQNLQDALRRIARNSNDSTALAVAGLAALKLGDTRAAIGFLAKADQIFPRSGRVKEGLARALLQEENPFGAIRYFDQAIKHGVPVQKIAADRGLAYDLIGRNAEAQRDYELALRIEDNDLIRSRYAISLGISGDMEKADIALNPLLQKSDRDAWRNRAFLLAMNGREKDANAIARQTMQKRLAKAIKPFFDRMPKLTAAQKAAAIHFGHFPASENIGVDVASVRYAANTAVRGGDGADAGLIPLGEPLGAEVKKPRVLAMPDTSERRRPGKTRSGKNRSSKKPVEIVVLDSTALPSPSGRSSRSGQNTRRVPANSREGRRLLRKAAREGSEEAQAYLDKQNRSKGKPVQAAKAEVPKPALVQPKTAPNPSPEPVATAVKTNTNQSVAPGFETAITPAKQKAAKPVQIATAEFAQPKLVSASVERKVPIGNVPPPKSLVPASASKLNTSAAIEPAMVPKPVEDKPVQLANFDLAKTVQSSTNQATQVVQADIERKPLSDIIKSISIPETETKTDVVPVNLETITPAKKPAPQAALKEEPKKAEPKQEGHPKRYWVQVATGSNLTALKYDFRQMKKKNTELFKNMDGWTSPWGNTRRMVVGPFDDLASAKKFDSTYRKNGGDSFAWVSKSGTEVNKLP